MLTLIGNMIDEGDKYDDSPVMGNMHGQLTGSLFEIARL